MGDFAIPEAPGDVLEAATVLEAVLAFGEGWRKVERLAHGGSRDIT